MRPTSVSLRLPQCTGPRAGVVGLLLLLSLVAVLSIIALTINVGMLSAVQARMNAGVESAALAGAAELMDPAPTLSLSAAGGQIETQTLLLLAAQEQRVAAARREAVRFAGRCGVCVRVAGGDASPDAVAAEETSDIIFGWVADPTSPASELLPDDGTRPVNAIEVRAVRSARGGDRIALWFGKLIGGQKAAMNVMARAAVDQRVYGFRPVGNVPVPMVPLAVIVAADEGSAGLPGTDVAFQGDGQDRYTVDARTGQVSPGPDGVPEVVLRLGNATAGADDADTGVAGAWFFLAAASADVWVQQTRMGFTAADLAPLGGQFALHPDGPLTVGLRAESGGVELARLREAVLAIRGQRRIWPLVCSDGPRGTVVGFAAGCPTDCRTDEDGNLLIVWQPTSMLTPTALTGGGVAANRWIGKVLLMR